MSDEPLKLSAELLDDFFAECDELLSAVRTSLTTLESDPRNAEVLQDLYRGMHTLKGNAAIVGLAAAERLAHATESLLRQLSRHEAELGERERDLLSRAAHKLEQTIGAFRLHNAAPDIGDLLRDLGNALPPATASPRAAEQPAPASAPAPIAASGPLWRAYFEPRTDLAQRGINVGTVRQRIAELGTILSASPQVLTGSRMQFSFVVSLTNPPPSPEAWSADGVTWSEATNEAPTTASPPETPAGEIGLFAAPSHLVRVDLSRLDELLRIASDLMTQRTALDGRLAKAPDPAIAEISQAFARSLHQLRHAVMHLRLVPMTEVFSRLPFVVRDLTRGTGKHVHLQLEGQHTEIDKHLIERLKEPLLHLVRNAISHGIETTDERVAAGKPAEATLLLKASASGDTLKLTIRDDGRGLDVQRIAARARTSGIAVPSPLDDVALLRLISMPGFSTRDLADRAAGRGLGMSVVDLTLREIGGTLAVASVAGQFTEFRLSVPLSLSIADTLIVAAGTRLGAVPQTRVTEIIQMRCDEIRTINRAEVGPYRGGLLPLVRLQEFFGGGDSGSAEMPVLVIETDRGPAGLAVDRVVGQREVVIRPMSDSLLRVPGISGATELGDGRPVLVLDAVSIIQRSRNPVPTVRGEAIRRS